jgi:hypothetical protein
MNPPVKQAFRPSMLALLSLLVGGCAPGLPATLAPAANEPPGYTWLACPGGNPTATVRAVIGPAGGTLTHPNGHALVVPPEAVPSNQTFVLHEPVSTHVQVVATVDEDVQFRVPISLTISYARCLTEVPADRLLMFRVNPRGEHDPLPGSVIGATSFRSDSLFRLSAYALATN